MQTLENWLSLNPEALKIPRIFTLARRGLKPISNDSSHILKYILSIEVNIRQLILKRYILNPEGQQRKTQNWKRTEQPGSKMRHHMIEELRREYPNQLPKSLDQTKKCPMSAHVGFYNTRAIL